MNLNLKSTCALLIFTVCTTAHAQQNPLTDEQYFKGNLKDIVQPLPNATLWTDNSHFLLIRDGKTFVVDAAKGTEREATSADRKNTIPVNPKTFIKNDDIFWQQVDSAVQLTKTPEKEVNPTLSPDGNYIAFTRNNDLYTIDTKTKKENRITTDGSKVILNGYSSWVYMEEILGRATKYKAFWWSPDSKHLAYFRSDDSNVPEFILVDGDGQHGLVEKQRYPKVGDPNPTVKIGISAPNSNTTTWIDFNENDDQYFGKPYWKPDGSGLLVQWMNRKQDTLKIWEADPITGKKKVIYTEGQKTWVDLDEDNRIKFLTAGKGFLLLSDVSGWKHIYHHSENGQLIKAVTTGKFTVTAINFVDEKKGIIYFTARGIENTARHDVYKIDFKGKNLKRMSFGEYDHTAINVSPEGKYFITTFNNSATPTKMAVVNSSGKVIKEIADSKSAGFNNYTLAKTALVRVKSDDGKYDLPMKITWPLNFDKQKKYPVLISVYGGPDRSNVMDTWTLTGSQQWYANDGLIQVLMDHRGSGHFGKEGIAEMYHNLGYWEITDYSTLVKWLVANGNADPTKICITGFSYGGYVSAYALTYGADVFTHAMVGGPVVDWSLYDSHYAERYMGTKADNAEGLKKSSVLTYTNNYKGMMQIVHGVVDDNVHMQNSLQLISKLQDEKKDFEFMAYPGGRHGWGGLKGQHFQNLKTKFIYKYLMEKEVPKGLLK